MFSYVSYLFGLPFHRFTAIINQNSMVVGKMAKRGESCNMMMAVIFMLLMQVKYFFLITAMFDF